MLSSVNHGVLHVGATVAKVTSFTLLAGIILQS